MLDLVSAFALAAVILTGAALASGLVERSPLSFPLLFLGLGFLLGEKGFGVITLDAHDPALEMIATLTLSLVLFLDGVKLQVEELGKRWLIPFLLLVPGTGLIIALGAALLFFLHQFPLTLAVVGGAALASTDPVVLREIVRDNRVPRSVRQVLKLDAGMNDLVVLPVVLIFIAIAGTELTGLGGWSLFLFQLLVLGPGIGFAIGAAGSKAMKYMDDRMGIRREHQALYGIGLVLAAFAASTYAGGDGFLAAFAAGLAVVVMNQTLCDCFLDYGEVTAEMTMLLAFVLFGAVLSGIVGTVDLVPTLMLAAVVIFILRPVVITLLLLFARLSWSARAFTAWFGPRGLNSLLLALLVVQAGVPGAELLLATVGVVVLVSVFIHGATASPFAAWYGRRVANETLEEERESTVADLFSHTESAPAFTTVEELGEALRGPEPPVILDVRSRSTYPSDGERIPGSVRVLPDEITDWAVEQPRDRRIVAYCA